MPAARRKRLLTRPPSRVKTIVSITLPHARDPTSDEFRSIERRNYKDLDEEVTESFSMEGFGSDVGA